MPTRIGLCAAWFEGIIVKANDGEPITDFIYGTIDTERLHEYKDHAEVAYKHLIESKAVDVELYITGLSSLSIAFIIAAKKYGKLTTLTFMHFDRASKTYKSQDALSLCE